MSAKQSDGGAEKARLSLNKQDSPKLRVDMPYGATTLLRMSEEVPSRSAPKPPEGARLLRGDGDVDVGTPGRFGGGRLPEALGTDHEERRVNELLSKLG